MVYHADVRCPLCHRDVASYFTVNDRLPACEACTRQVQIQLLDLTFDKVARGGAFGCGAALAVAVATGTAFALSKDAQVLGWIGSIGCLFAGAIVARAVRSGARGAGGPALQGIAIVLSLAAVFFSPAIASVREAAAVQGDIPIVVRVLLAIVLSPILFFAAGGIFALACTCFAIYDSYRRTARPKLDVKGPFTEDAPPAARAADAPAAPPDAAPAVPAPPPVADARAAGLDFERPAP
jgi:hypothetical protein